MHSKFTTHEFILALAQQHQREYIEALYAHLDTIRLGKETPFMAVHGALARRLGEYPHLVRSTGKSVSSKDIFGNENSAALFEKLT